MSSLTTNWRSPIWLAVLFFAVAAGFSPAPADLPAEAEPAPSIGDIVPPSEAPGQPTPEAEPAPAQEASSSPTVLPADVPRNPFWPVGYVPPTARPATPAPAKKPEPVKVVAPPKWDEAVQRLNIRGVMAIGEGRYMAMVNDQIVHEGDIVAVTHAGKRYRWRVHAITKGGVRFEPLDVADAYAK